jgi:hypothetical protein
MDKIGTSPLTRVFSKGRMNKAFDERVLPDGEYIDALNVRTGSTELSSLGALENSLGNTLIDNIIYENTNLTGAKCLGAFADSANETIYWFIVKPGVVDMILSHNMNTQTTTYHVVSTSVLNFNEDYLINGISLIEDLLFWTDNLNPPRRINIRRVYPQPIAGVDQITEEDINVIVKPPIYSPSIVMMNAPGEENYIDDRMVAFAYRYKYLDGEYSAMSPFSDIAFVPGQFELDYATYNNAGMENIFNAVEVSFNTGGSNVVGVDLCFKLSDENIINVIEKYDKESNGWNNNETKTVVFSNRKIYTTLLQSELLRLYDNVPLRAKAQTSIGNRIVYGNYVDGYDITSEDGIPITMDFSSELISEDLEPTEQSTDISNGVSYTINPASSVLVTNSKMSVELDPTLLKKNNTLVIDLVVLHSSFGGYPGYAPDAPENRFDFTYAFNFQRDYTSVKDLILSPEFIASISSVVIPIANSSDGVSLTDFFNQSIVAKGASGSVPAWTKEGTGISGINQGFAITSTPSDLNKFYIQCVAAKYKLENPPDSGLFSYAYEYFSYGATSAYIDEPGSKRSLHSNRDYQAGIVYLDEYGRSSTVLSSQENTVFCPPSASDKKNNIRININNPAPSWATNYKIFLKQSRGNYDTLFSDIYYTDNDGFTWFRISGENASKVSISSDLIVKKDSIGPMDVLVKTKPLEVVFKTEDFIDSNGITEPPGVYMKIYASNFSAITATNSFQEIKRVEKGSYTFAGLPIYQDNPEYDPLMPISIDNQPYESIPVPAGSLVRFRFSFRRDGRGGKCESFYYNYDKRFTASRDYQSIYEMVLFQNIDFTTGTYSGGEDPNTPDQSNTLIPYTGGLAAIQGTDQWVFAEGYEGTPGLSEKDGRLYLMTSVGVPSCSSVWPFTVARYVTNDSSITINQPSDIVIFETEAVDEPPDLYYESYETFDIVDGLHQGNVQNQTVLDPAILDSGFFNCFTFGNGCESYKYNDSIVGHSFYLGERYSSISEQDYQRANRYGSITYSGIYNSVTNVNKLNEFNLGLSNYEDLEYSFGPIQYLFGRKNDMLTLQEDKISYVLVGKDLLSDAAAGQALTSVPQVFGQQIPRLENYGMSLNPESFASYGAKMYFTDAKRMAVLSIEGSSYSNDNLSVISDTGMKYWFRDEFKDSVDKVRVGGYDPYMSEYVLSLKDDLLPTDPTEYDCGFLVSQFESNDTTTFIVNFGNKVGVATFDFNFESGSAEVSVEYDGVLVIDGDRVSSTSSITFEKSNPMVSQAIVTIDPTNATYTMSSLCPENEDLTVFKMVVNSKGDAEETIHAQFRWKYGSYFSPYDTDYVIFEDNGVSLEKEIVGEQSEGVIPINGSDVYLVSNKYSTDTYEFYTPTNRFRYLASNTLYDVATVLPLATEATPIINPSTGRYYAVAEDVNLLTNQYLYLIWDYRKNVPIELCYSVLSLFNVCCDCQSTSTFYIDHDSFELATGIYADEELTIPAPDGYYSLGNSSSYRVIIDGVLQPIQVCDDCFPCTVWTGGTFLGAGDIEVEFLYLDCNFVQQALYFTLPVNPTPDEAMTYTLSPYVCVIQGYVSMTPIEGVSDVTFDFNPEEVCGGGGEFVSAYRSSGSVTNTGTLCDTEDPDTPFFIVGASGCIISSGDYAYDTENIFDPFNGGDKFYKVYVTICDSETDSYICQIDFSGRIEVISECGI